MEATKKNFSRTDILRQLMDIKKMSDEKRTLDISRKLQDLIERV
jgi:uncharacterized protein YpiB (UPF0302 family)